MSIVDEIRKDVQGAALLIDWLGDGGFPVSVEVAERRAMTCACCIKNVAPNWWDKFKNRIAMTIRRQLEIKNKMQLRVKNEEDLHICAVCGCCNRLAVWAPIERIKEHTSDKELEEFVSFCWKRNEILKP